VTGPPAAGDTPRGMARDAVGGMARDAAGRATVRLAIEGRGRANQLREDEQECVSVC
jgi:hypothetical protein